MSTMASSTFKMNVATIRESFLLIRGPIKKLLIFELCYDRIEKWSISLVGVIEFWGAYVEMLMPT
jgi:hypothetical protein